MTTLRRRGARLLGLILALTAPTAAIAGPADAYYERALMRAADARCRLFAADVAAALAAGEAQARGAALKAGAPEDQVEAVGRAAEAKAQATPCMSKDLVVAAERVRIAFQGYSRLVRMSFPGDVAGWTADRSSSIRGPTWQLFQAARMDDGVVKFGLAGGRSGPAELIAAADFGRGPEPYAARLVLRDPVRAPEPYLDIVRQGASGGLALKSRTPPRMAARVFAAEARAPADPTLLSAGQKAALAFRFPAQAVGALAALDPREAVTLEFLYAGRSGDVIRRSFIEVGDFAAGRAFLGAAPH